jgi:hypothetical protein
MIQGAPAGAGAGSGAGAGAGSGAGAGAGSGAGAGAGSGAGAGAGSGAGAGAGSGAGAGAGAGAGSSSFFVTVASFAPPVSVVAAGVAGAGSVFGFSPQAENANGRAIAGIQRMCFMVVCCSCCSRGKFPSAASPSLDSDGGCSSLRSVYLFALASLSCSITLYFSISAGFSILGGRR